jgi:hypothetical protein
VNKHNKKSRYTAEDIARYTAVDKIRPAQFVHGAFFVSALMISILTFLARPEGTAVRGLALVQILGILGMLLWVVGYVVGFWIFKKRTTREAIEAALAAPFRGPVILAAQATDADKISQHLRKAWVVRTGAWEVGPVVCMLSVQVAIQGNLLASNPSLLSTGILPMIAFYGLCILTWPTRKRQTEILEKALLGK